MLSPSLFNVYLDSVIKNNFVLKEMVDQGKLLAFAEDLFFIMDNREEAEKALAACDRIDITGLKINRRKN